MKYLHIAITGHRNLFPQDEGKVKAAIKEVFQSLRKEKEAGIQLFCGLAPGADLWASECLDFEKGDELVYVQVLSEEMEKNYNYGGEAFLKEPERKKDEQVAKFNERLQVNEQNKNINEALWERRCKMVQSVNNPIEHFNATMEHHPSFVKGQFVHLAKTLVEQCLILVALWDGLDSGGAGGTSDVVRMWHAGKGIDGTSVSLPLQTRQFYHILCPRESNPLPIQRKDL